MQHLELRRPRTKPIELESGEHLGIIREAAHFTKFNNIRLTIHVWPEESDHPICLTYLVKVDWASNSEFNLMLAQIDRLPLEGDYLNPAGLVGIEVMVTTDEKVRIHNIRAATEAEATRTDWDDGDDLLNDNDNELHDDNQYELEDEESGYSWEGLEEPPLNFWQNGARSTNNVEPDWDALF